LIEFRSDTFTLPSPEMLAAMVSAPLGDDGYGEDPTVIQLEALAASKLGKESACLMPSGTMANLASILSHCASPGDIAIVGDQSDIYVYEDKGLAGCAGVLYCPLPTQPDGTLLLADVESAFRHAAANASRVTLLCIENPHNLCGGIVVSPGYIKQIAAFVHRQNAQLHLDGARIFNAALRLGQSPADLVKDVDSLQVCLSKGLAAPIGSLALGSSAFIEKVRQKRKMLGGNMRQAGIIAAAGIVALEQMVDRLEEDHINARQLAEGLAVLPGIQVDLRTVQTNTVVFRIVDSRFDCQSFIRAGWRHGMRLSDFKRGRIRAVTHYGTTADDIEKALQIFAQILEEGPISETVLPMVHAAEQEDALMGRAKDA
jgi:threonine aldolase